MKYDYLVVGSRLFGAIFANEANKKEMFSGRLGKYKYLDMDKVIAKALKISISNEEIH